MVNIFLHKPTAFSCHFKTDILYIFYIIFFNIFIVVHLSYLSFFDCCSTFYLLSIFILYVYIVMHQNLICVYPYMCKPTSQYTGDSASDSQLKQTGQFCPGTPL